MASAPHFAAAALTAVRESGVLIERRRYDSHT
jgi:hypothetical protein